MQEVCLSGIWKWLQMWVLLNLNLPVSLWRNVGKGVGTDAAEWLHGVNVKLSISWVQEIKHNSWWCKREVWALVSVTPKNLLQCLRKKSNNRVNDSQCTVHIYNTTHPDLYSTFHNSCGCNKALTFSEYYKRLYSSKNGPGTSRWDIAFHRPYYSKTVLREGSWGLI